MRLVFILFVLMVACVPAASSTGIPAAEGFTAVSGDDFALPAAERVIIRWFIGVGTGKTSEAMRTAADFVKRYNGSQDKVELELETITSSTHSAIDQLLDEIEAGNPPDIVAPADMGRAGQQLTGHILPLDDFLAGYDLSSIDPAVLDFWRANGELIGLPAGAFSSVIFYNGYLFDAAGLPYPPHQFRAPYADGGGAADTFRGGTIDVCPLSGTS